ncbi:hypothetical protein BD309DRAFT_985146, partial [Dichomitus squalens]
LIALSLIPLVLQHERIRTPFRITWESVSAAFDGWKLESTPTVEFDWDGEAPIAFCFSRYNGLAQQSTLWFVLGVCDLAEPRQHFARFYVHLSHASAPSPDQYLTHNWRDSHGRPDGSYTWYDRSGKISLSFTPCPVYDTSVLVLGQWKEPVNPRAYSQRSLISHIGCMKMLSTFTGEGAFSIAMAQNVVADHDISIEELVDLATESTPSQASFSNPAFASFPLPVMLHLSEVVYVDLNSTGDAMDGHGNGNPVESISGSVFSQPRIMQSLGGYEQRNHAVGGNLQNVGHMLKHVKC